MPDQKPALEYARPKPPRRRKTSRWRTGVVGAIVGIVSGALLGVVAVIVNSELYPPPDMEVNPKASELTTDQLTFIGAVAVIGLLGGALAAPLVKENFSDPPH